MGIELISDHMHVPGEDCVHSTHYFHGIQRNTVKPLPIISEGTAKNKWMWES
jgi:hypothetical protein